MPLDDKRKQMFSDLGRPTKRGVKKCPKCGTLNGTRGNSCKNKSCDVIFRDNGSKKKPTTDACRIIVNNSTAEIYSVRLRDRGPDYRNFVQLQQQPMLTTPLGVDTNQCHGTFPKCFVSLCNRNRIYPCTHIKAAQKCFTTARRVHVKHSLIDSLPISQECKQVLSNYVIEFSDLYVQRCSKTSFVVKCHTSTRHPLGYLHILFFKPNSEEGTAEPKFLCTCRPFKIPNHEADVSQNSGSSTLETPSKLCIHFYSCILAFASNEDLAAEFEHFISAANFQAHTTHGHPMPVSVTDTHGESMVSNLSGDLVRENVSLLEGLASGEEATLATINNVHLDGAFTDHIIVTNSENGIIFAGNTVLEEMDESEVGAQVCSRLTHISEILDHSNQNQQVVLFSSQLPDSFTQESELVSAETSVQILTDAMLTNTSEESVAVSGENNLVNPATDSTSTLTLKRTSECLESPIVTSVSVSGTNPQDNITATYSTASTVSSASECQTYADKADIEKKLLLAHFEKWLANVNERINATMNYHLSGKPEPLVYYVCHEYFEIIKERITSGCKKKRLPNQTRVIHYRDRAPVGNFMKYVWNITNIVHVLHIFHSTLVPLKINQFFVHHPNGSYNEWLLSNNGKEDETSKNKSIVPVLHGTSLKIGKSDLTAKESVPFSIEWIPDILPQSRHGELTLSFQFSHTGPIHTDEERRNSLPSLQNMTCIPRMS